MTTLRVILDPMVSPTGGGVGRYAEELTRALIETAPRGSQVAGVVSASPEDDYAHIEERLPGLAVLHKSALARRELQAAWQHGFTPLPGEGIVHGTSLLAPLSRHDRLADPGSQVAVTIHDALPWTDPESLAPRHAAWQRAMGRRARKYADAVVVPTHAVADILTEELGLGDRVRVIGGAPSARMLPPVDASARAISLDLPDRYLLTFGAPDAHKGLEPLIRALASPETADVPLLIAGADSTAPTATDIDAVIAEAGLPEGRVRRLGHLDDADLATVLSRAAVYVAPSLVEGFGMSVIEAFAAGTPVVHSDAPALVEIGADAGFTVERGDPQWYPTRLADAIGAVLEEPQLAERLRVKGLDRAGAFSWRDSGEKVWQLHADL